MFTAVCHEVVHDVGKGILIPSPSLDESRLLLPLNVMTMRKKRKFIFFHRVEYTAENICLAYLLTDQSVLNVHVEESNCCTLNHPEGTFTMYMQMGANMKGIAGASVSASNKLNITANLGQLHREEIATIKLTSVLKERRIDMNNSFIKQINDKKTVLCVVTGVIKTSDSAEIICRDMTNVNMNLSTKGYNQVSVDLGAASNISKHMVIERGTTLAYKFCELSVDGNIGTLLPVMTKNKSGGFSPKSHEMAKPFKEKLQPLRDCIKAGNQTIKSSLLELMTSYGDVVVVSQILSKAENGSLNEDKDTFNEQLINIDTVWSILKCVGVHIKKGRVLYERKKTKILTAVAYMTDAILEIKDDDLEKIRNFNEPQLEALSNILESAVVGTGTIRIDVDTSSVLKEPISSFLRRLKFKVCKDSIQPPKKKSNIVEFIFCVVYCLA